jgi:hypothetical protein
MLTLSPGTLYVDVSKLYRVLFGDGCRSGLLVPQILNYVSGEIRILANKYLLASLRLLCNHVN